jgi:hypothetical protein
MLTGGKEGRQIVRELINYHTDSSTIIEPAVSG